MLGILMNGYILNELWLQRAWEMVAS